MNLQEIVVAPLNDPRLLWLSVAFLVNSCVETGSNIIIGRNRLDEYKVELEMHLQSLERTSTEARTKIQDLDLQRVFLYDGRLVRMSAWSVLLFWTWLGLLVGLLILNWKWTLVQLLVTGTLFFLPVFRRAGLFLAKPLHRDLRAGVDY